MPNHEARYLGHIHIDVSFKYEREYWDQQITAHAVVTVPGMDDALHVVKSTGSIDMSRDDYPVRNKYETDIMWNALTYFIKRRLEEDGKFPNFPAIEQEKAEKPCPFQAKD